DFDGFGLAGDGAVGAGDGGHAGFFDGVLGHGLVAHHHDGLGLGADELDVARLALLGELGVLGEKTVAGVDGIDVGEFGGGDDAVGAQVALGAFGGADADGLVGELHVERLGVGLGIDREGFDAEFAAGAHDAERDFTAVGDEDLLNHKNEETTGHPHGLPANGNVGGRGSGWSVVLGWVRVVGQAVLTLKRRWPYSTGAPFSTRASTMVPLVSAWISFMIFMASMMQTTLLSVILEPGST